MCLSNFDINTTEFCQYSIKLMLYNEEQGRRQNDSIRVLIPHLSYVNLKLWLKFWGFVLRNCLAKWIYKTRLRGGKLGQNTAILVLQVLCLIFC